MEASNEQWEEVGNNFGTLGGADGKLEFIGLKSTKDEPENKRRKDLLVNVS